MRSYTLRYRDEILYSLRYRDEILCSLRYGDEQHIIPLIPTKRHAITFQQNDTRPHVARGRGRGRPRNTWRRDFIAEMEIDGYAYRWQDLERVSQNRTRWRTVVSGLCTTKSKVQQA